MFKYVQLLLFADDATIFFMHQNLAEKYGCHTNDLKIIQNWFQVNGLLFNASKTKYVIFHNKKGNITEGCDLSIG